MPDLLPFQYQSYEIRVQMDEQGNPWWVAKDVCDTLAIADHRQAYERLDADEKGWYSIPSPGGEQKTMCVNESGLYNLILRSRKPEAKAFKRWITHEVLPAIRKTGSYQHTAVPQVKNPAHQLLIDTVVRLDEVEQRALSAEQAAHAAELRAERAEGKADILFDARRMTVKDFILKNGLLPQFPMTQWPRISKWMLDWCRQYDIKVLPCPVVGVPWDSELDFPIDALAAWLRYEQKKPQQIALVPRTQKG